MKQELTNKKVSFHTLGCRLNMSETGSIAQGFVDRGYDIVEFGETADVVFLNTCTVTDSADSTCRNLIRKAQKTSPEGKIVVAGCYAQMEAEKISKMTGVDLILGNSEKYKVFEYLHEDDEQTIKVDKSFDFWGAATTTADTHTRAFLKIQDGCNYVCSFCIIPFARGRSRAISIEDALKEAQNLIDRGFKEIVLTGVNIGEYESSSGEKLSHMVEKLLAIPGLERLRMSSVEPNTITKELLEVMKSSPKFLDHFHIPMQAGDDTTLKNMRRKYTVADYKKVIETIKQFYPNAAIGADMITGFPGETEEQYLNTFNLARELPITHFHVFPYSKRKNTTAAAMEGHIQHGVKKDRVRRLIMLGEAKLDHFMHENIGRTSEVLFEEQDKNGYWSGLSSNYIRVKVKSDDDLKNKILSVKMEEVKDGVIFGTLIH
ncbi:MAG: tRNA (N(6)-L-threonylcarbamoyladenosine(37)-C(2))-methylthiotransferase MtaB [Bacteriovoracaceae bacterium]